MTDNLLNVHEASDRLGLTLAQVYRRVARGDLPVAGNYYQYLFRPEVVDAYLEAGKPLSNSSRTTDAQYMRTPEAAQTLGLSVEAVRKLCFEGKLKFTRGPGRNAHLRIARSSVESFRRHQLHSDGVK